MAMFLQALPEWLAAIWPVFVAISGVGVILQSIRTLTRGQEALQSAVQELTSALSKLATASAVNAAQHDDITRQIAEIHQTLGKQGEQIVRLRTRVHVHANKLQELDPGWKAFEAEVD